MRDRRTTTHEKTPPKVGHKQLGIRVTADMSDRLESIARAEHNGVSSVVRRMLAAALDEHGSHEGA
jgi:hypothetical protein